MSKFTLGNDRENKIYDRYKDDVCELLKIDNLPDKLEDFYNASAENGTCGRTQKFADAKNIFSCLFELAKSPAKIAYYIPVLGDSGNLNGKDQAGQSRLKINAKKDYLHLLLNVLNEELLSRKAEGELSEEFIFGFSSMVDNMLFYYNAPKTLLTSDSNKSPLIWWREGGNNLGKTDIKPHKDEASEQMEDVKKPQASDVSKFYKKVKNIIKLGVCGVLNESDLRFVQAYLDKLESGEEVVNSEQIECLSKMLKVKIDYFKGLSENYSNRNINLAFKPIIVKGKDLFEKLLFKLAQLQSAQIQRDF